LGYFYPNILAPNLLAPLLFLFFTKNLAQEYCDKTLATRLLVIIDRLLTLLTVYCPKNSLPIIFIIIDYLLVAKLV
jgi:hypothetical protein